MKKAIIFILILITITAIYRAVATPEWVKINHAETQRCFEDMQQNESLICD